jgi:hypothetical protein
VKIDVALKCATADALTVHDHPVRLKLVPVFPVEPVGLGKCLVIDGDQCVRVPRQRRSLESDAHLGWSRHATAQRLGRTHDSGADQDLSRNDNLSRMPNRAQPKTLGQWIRYIAVAVIAIWLVVWMLRISGIDLS